MHYTLVDAARTFTMINMRDDTYIADSLARRPDEIVIDRRDFCVFGLRRAFCNGGCMYATRTEWFARYGKWLQNLTAFRVEASGEQEWCPDITQWS